MWYTYAMPKYDFVCTPCDSIIEMHVAFDSNEQPACDRCGNYMTKVYTVPAIKFNGSGFYSTGG